jgi:hypothetical protein
MTATAVANGIFTLGLMLFVAASPVRAAKENAVTARFGKYIAAESPYGAVQADRGRGAPEAPVGRLAGANGHDTVGGLMPLPLWPSTGTLRTPGPAKSARLFVRHPARLRR